MKEPYRSSSPLTRTEDKYNNDTAFRHVVDVLQMAIGELQLTPGEVREAAVYACMRLAAAQATAAGLDRASRQSSAGLRRR